NAAFGAEIDPNNWTNYTGQTIPAYIQKNNSPNNPINNAKATLGRVLFYDNSLSVTNTISCGSCHQQKFAFSDTALASNGVLGGTTDRHTMRLINARFAIEPTFFWDERAATLEAQSTQPIVAHNEMGFSGQTGRGNMNTLLTKLQGIGYYKELFTAVYGDVNITETRMQECLANFIRSIQSFDSKFDEGRALVVNDRINFPNFTAEENLGKALFIDRPIFDANSIRTTGGLGCNTCHLVPEFDISPASRNNGVIATLAGIGNDVTNTRSPSLRDLMNSSGVLNGPMMHNGKFRSLEAVVNHYASGIQNNSNLDPRLRPNGTAVQQLNLQPGELQAIIAFMKTLTGKNIYTDKKWATPFL
ncbi:MAG: cytochrome-c peroxidase, partial [Chitinophagaceae bacterium]|nr:cytochrome-c peroxidase [Chitinophagaceae bacterium]